MVRIPYTAAICGVLAGALLPLEAGAQQSQDGQPESGLEEIIVTAQKREQRLQDVSLSISVLDEATIEDAGVDEVDDIVLLTPGLDFSQTLGRQNTQPLIRGIAPTFLTDPTVVVLVDGFTLGFTRLVNNSLLFDLERIEVLKGPQATLYGRNALGGVINYITTPSSDTFGGMLGAEYGSYDSFELNASVTGPLAETLSGRVTAGMRSMGGYLDNQFDGAEDVNDEEDVSVRGSLRWVPTDDLEFDFTATYGEGEDGCGDCSHISSVYDRTDPDRFLEIGAGLVDFNDTTQTTNMSFLGGYDREDLTVSLNTTWSLPNVTMTSITGYGYIDAVLDGDSNGPSVGSFIPGVDGYTVPIYLRGFSEELRLGSSDDGGLTWLTGLYAYRSTSDSSLYFGPARLTGNERKITNYAGFANAEYPLTEFFSVALGLRYDYEEQVFFNKLSGGVTERTASEWLPRVSVSFRPNDQVHWYVTASRGYHAGGFNDPRAPDSEYDSEYVWNYEVGLKAGFLDNRMQAQVTA
ncbi:MAG: TonB-dependent receptor, partial [Geminicoccales bacterium]